MVGKDAETIKEEEKREGGRLSGCSQSTQTDAVERRWLQKEQGQCAHARVSVCVCWGREGEEGGSKL